MVLLLIFQRKARLELTNRNIWRARHRTKLGESGFSQARIVQRLGQIRLLISHRQRGLGKRSDIALIERVQLLAIFDHGFKRAAVSCAYEEERINKPFQRRVWAERQ